MLPNIGRNVGTGSQRVNASAPYFVKHSHPSASDGLPNRRVVHSGVASKQSVAEPKSSSTENHPDPTNKRSRVDWNAPVEWCCVMTTTDHTPNSESPSKTTCVIAGGGPAGLVLGLLLARAGVEVTVLEKHADFLRDFRGDTVHPTTLGLLDDLGLFEQFDELPQSRLTHLQLPNAKGKEIVLVDFRRLPLRHPYIAMVPQWDLLNLLAEAAALEPNFTLLTKHEVTDVLYDHGRVTGVQCRAPDGEGQLLADLTVACDGRWSTIRQATALPVKELPVGFDVWWYRVNTEHEVGTALLPRIDGSRLAVVIRARGIYRLRSLGQKVLMRTCAPVGSRRFGRKRRNCFRSWSKISQPLSPWMM